MTDTTAKLAARILDDEVGIPTADAEALYTRHGSTRLAIVELESYRFTEDLDGTRTVTVRLSHLELVPADQEDFARDFSAAIYRARQPAPLDPDLGQEGVSAAADRGRRMLMCEACLHPRADTRIRHAPDPDADGAFCTWDATGTEVGADEEEPPAADVDDEHLVKA